MVLRLLGSTKMCARATAYAGEVAPDLFRDGSDRLSEVLKSEIMDSEGARAEEAISVCPMVAIALYNDD